MLNKDKKIIDLIIKIKRLNMNFIKNVDTNMILFFGDKIQNTFLNPIMIFFTEIGNIGLIWIFISFILIIKKKYRKVGITTIMALIINSILGEGLIKNIIQRPRPFTMINNINLLIPAPTSYSFPSGHTSSSFACAIVIAYYLKKLLIPSISLAILIAISRLYLQVHYLSDIIGGIILGIISAIISIKLINFIYNKYIDKRTTN